MKKYYDEKLPITVHVIYGGRYAGRTYRELKKLEEENKALKEQLDMLVKDDEEQQKTIIRLRTIIDKAIEYIKDHERNVYDTFGEGVVFGEMGGIKELLKILKGE